MIKKFAILFVVAVVGYFILAGLPKKANPNARLSKLPCQKEVVVFERVYDIASLEKVLQYIGEGSFDIGIREDRAIHSKSNLFEYLNILDVKEMIQNSLLRYSTRELNQEKKNLHVDVVVYENDKDNPGKKTPASKLYRGYLVISFLLEKDLIYKVQIDFMDFEAKDVPKRVDCAIDTLMQYKDKK